MKELASRAWNSLTANQKRSALLRQQVQANRKIVQNYIEEFQLSKRSLLDVLDAERAKFNNEVQKLSSEASLSFARFRMLAAQSKLSGYFGHCASSNDLEHGACLVIGGSGSLFDVKPLGVDVASDGSGLSVF